MLVGFTAHKFVQHVVEVAGPSLVDGLVGQADFMYKFVEGYTLGVFGVQLWRRMGASTEEGLPGGCRWKKQFLPLIFLFANNE